MLAFGKLRLCLVGSRLHFPSENRQSRADSQGRALSRPPQRAELSPCFKQTASRRLFGRSKISLAEIFAPSPSAPFWRGMATEISPYCGCIQVIARPYRDFVDIL